ncbi:ferredoxin--nitrite reductase [Halarcobacter ebronensis]|uniref:Ferredoxin--nitrite reductase n=1 Tax=Halarcobacter ebronensis TaxID=1462615 RepID=A0A4Q0Y7Q3_9BACT|nr:nitrite/sulfite reductase [Halarcobacter ebronensis]RXJ65903.1 ferredoxin--nitrite reductase [Halarcobacter ebronensis]
MITAPKKESKAARVERIKKEKDGLDVLQDIYLYAITGEAVDPEDIDRLKWYGLYTQNRNLQDENDETLYFMLRVKLIGGKLNLEQLKTIADISKKYARGTADFTTRQDLQFHYIRVVDLPEIFRLLDSVGLSTIFAAGDVPRNVVSCPVNGIDEDEIADVRDVVDKINEALKGNRAFSNLPRKFKIGVNGCSCNCINHEMQDLSFNAVKQQNGKIHFAVSVGGGLASNRRVADHIGYVTPSQVLPLTKAVIKIYRDNGNRDNRRKARLGHIIEEWGVQKFREILQNNLTFRIKDPNEIEYVNSKHRDHFGIHASKVKNSSFIGCALNSGHIGLDGLEKLVLLFEKYDAKALKATVTQNIVITQVPTKNAQALAQELEEVGISPVPSNFKAKIQACTGLNFCKFAISETKGAAKNLVEHLEKKFPDFGQRVSISINGCPNSCAHAHIVDIGLIGTKVKNKEGQSVVGYDLFVGGFLEGVNTQFSKKTNIKFPQEDLNENIENLITEYLESKYTTFVDFLLTKAS